MKILFILGALALVVGGVAFMMQSPDGGTPVITETPKSSVSVVPTSKQAAPTSTATIAPSTTPTAQSHAVTLESFAFAPRSFTVKRGDAVIFTNKDSAGHTVTSLTGAFESGIFTKNQTFRLDTSTLAPGTYDYKCTPHSSMRGTLIVQ